MWPSDKSQLITALGINFGIWGVAVVPAYLVVRKIGIEYIGVIKEGGHETKDDVNVVTKQESG